jgi:hypothetical protein
MDPFPALSGSDARIRDRRLFPVTLSAYYVFQKAIMIMLEMAKYKSFRVENAWKFMDL